MAQCKGCGKPIIWGVTDDGKRIPLDPKPPVYQLLGGDGGRTFRATGGFFVSHFATCPKANDFSSNRKPQGDLFT